MIEIRMLKDDLHRFCGFHVVGHSGYQEEGSDIVCSAVSTLTINTVNSLEHLTHTRFTLQTDEKRGEMKLLCKDAVTDSEQLLFQSLELGLKSIADSYSEYVNLIKS